ncbi:hypothetical protein NKR19_g5994 [Coniochaeta hoffmannii]|uniref:Uncharacterized protein n=1 Tax=Coniochaeta hoffmannii TaxID=91930 RepID=A0AA38VF49_9PEZI|nr:hypothetical protein NKR19_g5994 [Coniochaeta hoffmannii]
MLGSRRHRPPPKQQPLTAATAHPNAAMAAAAVFKQREQQPASLSAAAAAAALRARPMTPTNVGETGTTKTWQQRIDDRTDLPQSKSRSPPAKFKRE